MICSEIVILCDNNNKPYILNNDYKLEEIKEFEHKNIMHVLNPKFGTYLFVDNDNNIIINKNWNHSYIDSLKIKNGIKKILLLDFDICANHNHKFEERKFDYLCGCDFNGELWFWYIDSLILNTPTKISNLGFVFGPKKLKVPDFIVDIKVGFDYVDKKNILLLCKNNVIYFFCLESETYTIANYSNFNILEINLNQLNIPIKEYENYEKIESTIYKFCTSPSYFITKNNEIFNIETQNLICTSEITENIEDVYQIRGRMRGFGHDIILVKTSSNKLYFYDAIACDQTVKGKFIEILRADNKELIMAPPVSINKNMTKNARFI